MAVYYVSPYTTTNGTGTWASPYSLAVVSRATLASGDEVRLVAKYLTDILTATTYTATYTSSYQLTITAGGALGADFASVDTIYLPGVDAFCKIMTVVGNVIAIASTGVLPWYDTSSGQSITVRKVNYTAAPNSFTTATGTIWNAAFANNVTVSDGWVADGVRVTDSSAKSLVNPSVNGASTINFDCSGATAVQRSGVVFDLPNTHFMSGNNPSSGGVLRIMSGGSTITIGQLLHSASTQGSAFQIGSTSLALTGVSVTLKHCNAPLLLGAVYMYGGSFTVENGGTSNLTSYIVAPVCKNVTFTVDKLVAVTGAQNYIVATTGPIRKNTFNFTQYIDLYNNESPDTAIVNGCGDFVVNFSAGFVFRRSRRTGTITTVLSGVIPISFSTNPPERYPLPTVNAAGVFSVTNPTFLTLNPFPGIINANGFGFKRPRIINYDCPKSSQSAPANGITKAANILVTHQDGTAPYEVLGIDNLQNNAGPSTLFPVAKEGAPDIAHTTGPSMQAYLATFQANYWAVSTARARKNIKVPVISGVSYTISGYIRTDIASFVNGDCRVCIVNDTAEVAGQDMTTACINAWEQFTLTFTAAFTGELVFVWEMRFAEGAKSIWLDDLTIT